MTISKAIEVLVGSIDDKRRWRRYKARARQLPEPYHAALDALARYVMYYGSITKGDVAMSMLEDLADLVEQSAANGTPVRAIVGEDPVEFAEEFVRNYSEAQWINKERERLVEAINRLTDEES